VFLKSEFYIRIVMEGEGVMDLKRTLKMEPVEPIPADLGSQRGE
jgi:hypothetical protein